LPSPVRRATRARRRAPGREHRRRDDERCTDAGSADADSGSNCPSLKNDTPHDLACTGLYANLASKTVADGLRPYAPAVPFWSDGADKNRWIYLPPGTAIDGTDALEWNFPVGTKVWKEFNVGGHRVETRFFEKLGASFWVHASYQWSADETSALRVDGADFTTASGASYHIPIPSECDKCHNGRKDGRPRLRHGLARSERRDRDDPRRSRNAGLIMPKPTKTSYQMRMAPAPAAKALGLAQRELRESRATTANTTATAYGTGLRFRLDPAQLDGQAPSSTWEALSTSLAVPATTPNLVRDLANRARPSRSQPRDSPHQRARHRADAADRHPRRPTPTASRSSPIGSRLSPSFRRPAGDRHRW